MSVRRLDSLTLNPRSFLGRNAFFLLTPLRVNQGEVAGGGGSLGGGLFHSLGDQRTLWVGNESGGITRGIEPRSWRGMKTPVFAFYTANGVALAEWLEPTGESPLNMPFRNRQHWTVLSIFQTANPIYSSGDPRIFSKDIGSGETDHTFMIGFTGGGATARCRIGFAGSRCASGGTLLVGGANIAADNRFIIAASYDGATLRMQSLRWSDGSYDSGSAARTGDVTLNTDTTKIARNAGVTENYFPGWIECVMGVDAVLTREDLTRLLYQDWRAELLARPRIVVGKAPAAGGATISPSGIASAEAFGTATLTPGEVTVSPSAIASAEAFGTPVLEISIAPTGIASDEAFGTAVLSVGEVTISPTGIASAEAFGTANVFGDQTITGAGGIASAEAHGAHTILPGQVTLLPLGIGTLEAFGAPTVVGGDQTIFPSGIASAEAFGTPTVTGGQTGGKRMGPRRRAGIGLR